MFYLALALASLAWVGLREGSIPVGLFVHPTLGANALDVAVGLLSAGFLIALWNFAEHVWSSAGDLRDLLAERLSPLAMDEVLALAVLSGFAEELFFRGAVQGSWGVVWATVLFALLHAGPARELRAWGVFALIAGALFGGLMVWRSCILAPVIGHFAVNAVGLARLEKHGRSSRGDGPGGDSEA